MQAVTEGGGANASAPSDWDRYDTMLVLAIAVATIALHPLHRILTAPYWEDEGWVADLTRASWSEVARIGSPTPVGFVALLKLVPGSGLQRARLVPLAFNVLSGCIAYVLTRSLAWGSRRAARAAATAVAAVVTLAPLSLQRNDLKQYTCDAFCALLLLAVATAVDRNPTRVPVWCLGAVAVVVLPFSSTSAFVSVAVFAALLVSALLARDRRLALETFVVGVVAGLLIGAYYLLVVLPKLSSTVTSYWSTFYLSGSPFHVASTVWERARKVAPHLGTRGFLLVALFAIGCVVLDRKGGRAVALAVPVVALEMIAMGRLRKYPFADVRTSHFLLVASLVVAAIGAVGLVQWIAARLDRRLAAVVGLALGTMFVVMSVPHVHDMGIPGEDIRTPTLLTARLYHPGDVILVSEPANFGFAYYWPRGAPVLHTDSSGSGFRAQAGGVSAVYVKDRTAAAVRAGLDEALRRWRRAGPRAHLFILRTHLDDAERLVWRRVFSELHLRPAFLGLSREPSYVLGPPFPVARLPSRPTVR